MRKIRMAMIGCGDIAHSVHGPSYVHYAQEHPLERVSCVDIDAARASAFAERYGFARYDTDYREMIRREAPDAICLITPARLTAQIALDVMSLSDAALFIEKPPGCTPEETRSLIEMAKRKGIANQVAFNRRHMPIIKALRAGMGGDTIDYIRCDFYRSNRRDDDFATTAIHGIDAVCSLVASPVANAFFRYQELPDAGDHVSNAYVDMTFESGTVAHLSFCPMAGAIIERLTVNVRNRTLMAHLPVWNAVDTPGRLIKLYDGKVESDTSGADLADSDDMYITNGFYAENASFFDDVMACAPPRDHLGTALKSVQIADCIRKRATWYAPGEDGMK